MRAERLLGGSGLADHLEVVFDLEQLANSAADDLVVIEQEHANGHRGRVPPRKRSSGGTGCACLLRLRLHPPMDPVIDTHDLTKRFGKATALDHLTLTVGPGEVFGFLGPNGAGKTTTVRLLLGIIRASEGSVHVFGRDAWADAVAVHRRVAYVPGELSLWPQLTGGETLALLGALHGPVDDGYRDELCERFAFDPSKKVRSYSKGNRQKIGLIAALMTSCGPPRARRTDLGSRPVDGDRVSLGASAKHRTGARPCSSPPTSSRRSRRCAGGSASFAPAVSSTSAHSARCATSARVRSSSNSRVRSRISAASRA